MPCVTTQGLSNFVCFHYIEEPDIKEGETIPVRVMLQGLLVALKQGL